MINDIKDVSKKLFGSWCDKAFVKCFIVCFATAFFSFICFVMTEKGAFSLISDFYSQQIPFTMTLNDVFQRGLDSWNWNLDLGTSTLHGFSFYELGSPFFWLTTLFPAEWFIYMTAWIFMLKYTVAGLSAFVYLRRFVNNIDCAVIGGVLYAFSGFQTVNMMFYHFHDVVAFFPLLLLGMERLIEDHKKKKFFVFSVFLNCLVNYYFFIQEVVFLVLYFCFRFIDRDIKKMIKRLLLCAFCGICGIAMAAILFIPNILYIMGNPRSTFGVFLSNLIYDSKYILFILKGMLIPGETMDSHSAILEGQWTSTSCYLPMIGISMVICYVIKNRNWLSRLLKTLFVFCFSPLLTSLFLLTTTSIQRWWYMFVLVMVLATVKVLDEKERYNIQYGLFVNIAAIIAFYLILCIFKWSKDSGTLIFDKPRFLLYTTISLLGIASVWLLYKKDRFNCKTLLLGVMLFSVVTTAHVIYRYQKNWQKPYEYSNTIQLYTQFETIDDQYRYNADSNPVTLIGDVSGLSSFSSTVSNSITRFDMLFKHFNGYSRLNKNNVPGLAQLLGGKYHVAYDKGEDTPVREYSYKDKKAYIMEKPACPIGYAVYDYILEEDLMKLDVEKRGIALLSAAVVAEKDESAVAGLANRRRLENIDFEMPIDEYVEENSFGAVSGFKRSDYGFRCKSNYLIDTLVYFSVPNDEGWSAFVDGEKTEIIDSGGMMLLPVPPGESEIVFEYSTPGYRVSSIVSMLSLAVFYAMCVYDMLKKLGITYHSSRPAYSARRKG